MLEAGAAKRKCIVDEMEDLRLKLQHLDNDIVELNTCAEEFAIRAEQARDLTFVSKSNAMHASAKVKQRDLLTVSTSYEKCVASLQDL